MSNAVYTMPDDKNAPSGWKVPSQLDPGQKNPPSGTPTPGNDISGAYTPGVQTPGAGSNRRFPVASDLAVVRRLKFSRSPNGSDGVPSSISSSYHGKEIPGSSSEPYHSYSDEPPPISRVPTEPDVERKKHVPIAPDDSDMDSVSTTSSVYRGREIPGPEDPMRASQPSALRDFGDKENDLKKVMTEPDVEHNEHVPIAPGTQDASTSRTSASLQKTRSFMGLHPNAPVDDEADFAERSDLWWSKVRLALREPFAEFFGVFIMVLFGDGSVAQVLLSAGEQSAPGGDGYG